MNHFIIKTILFSAIMFAATSARAAATDYDSGITIDTMRTAFFHEKFASNFRVKNPRVFVSGLDGESFYLTEHFSPHYTAVAFTKKDLLHGENVPVTNLFPGQNESAHKFAPASVNTRFIPSLTSDSSTSNAENSNMTSVSLLGPIPEPSIKWLLIGALIALAGLSSGMRGIHESV